MKNTKIENYTVYNEGMRKSLLDKIFFVDKINVDTIVDYGCADGILISFLSKLFPEYNYIGYDIDEGMIKLAKQNNKQNNCFFSSDWELIKEKVDSDNTAVLLSSVVHEVYAYGTKRDVMDMWSRVYGGFKYVIIRDMIPSVSINKRSDINDVMNIIKKSDSGRLREFERLFGSVEENKNLIHFLLKYRYIDNWSREVRENYFPLFREELLASIPDGFNIQFHEHFILPYVKNKIREDFDISIKDNTHLKLILERKIK